MTRCGSDPTPPLPFIPAHTLSPLCHHRNHDRNDHAPAIKHSSRFLRPFFTTRVGHVGANDAPLHLDDVL